MPEALTRVNPHWRARLADVQDLLLVAHDTDDVVKALLQLTSVLADEWPAHHAGDAALAIQLVREALDVFDHRESAVNVTDWIKTAKRLLAIADGETEAAG